MRKSERIVNAEMNAHDVCKKCGMMMPVKKAEYGECHDGDCSKHNPENCLVCSNMCAWQEKIK